MAARNQYTTAKAVVNFSGFAARLEAAPFQNDRLSVPPAARRSALLHRYITVGIFRPEIFRPGANQAVVIELLDHVRGPAADAGDREYGSKHIFIDAQHVVGGSGVEIHVGVELLFRFHELLDFFRHLIPLRLSAG